MENVTVEKICGGKSETRKIKDFRPGDIVMVPALYGTYVLLGRERCHGQQPLVDTSGFTKALHITEEDGSDAPLRLTSFSVSEHCTVVGRLRNLQWSGFEAGG